MAWLAAGLQIVGTAVSVIGQLSQGDAKSQAAEYNAQTAESLANQTQLQGIEQARRVRVNALKTIGEAKANYGASGVQLEGSALDILQESAQNATLDALNVKYQSDLKAFAYRRDAGSQRAAGENAKTASVYGAAASLLTGGANIASKL